MRAAHDAGARGGRLDLHVHHGRARDDLGHLHALGGDAEEGGHVAHLGRVGVGVGVRVRARVRVGVGVGVRVRVRVRVQVGFVEGRGAGGLAAMSRTR